MSLQIYFTVMCLTIEHSNIVVGDEALKPLIKLVHSRANLCKASFALVGHVVCFLEAVHKKENF